MKAIEQKHLGLLAMVFPFALLWAHTAVFGGLGPFSAVLGVASALGIGLVIADQVYRFRSEKVGRVVFVAMCFFAAIVILDSALLLLERLGMVAYS